MSGAAALGGLRVLECGDLVAAPYAATILGHLGADVVKVEPPVGDSNRRRGPFPVSNEGVETSGLHLFLDQAKRSVIANLETEGGRAVLRSLAASADLLIASGSVEELRRKGLTYDGLKATNPRLVVTSITPQGMQAADPRRLMRDLTDLATGGWLALSPTSLEDAALPPLKPFGQQSHYQAGLHAVIASLGALSAREETGLGQHVDVSVQAVIASQIENALMHFLYSGTVASRLGVRILGPWGMVQLEDGLLFIVCATETDWHALLGFLGNPDWADSELFADRLVRATNNDALLSLIESEMAGRTVAKTYAELQDIRVPCAPLNDMKQLLEHPHLADRGFFESVDHPVAGTWTYPGAMWKFSGTAWQVGRRAPLLGEHHDEVLREWGAAPTRARAVAPAAHGADTLPLAGVRVVAFTWVWAGPMAGMQLAHLGADVIRIESRLRMDTLRAGIGPHWKGQPGPNSSGYVNQYSQGKRSMTLSLKEPQALELAYALISRADVVIDNFSAGALERLGLGYEKLRSVKPDIIQVSMAGHGQTGPIARYVAYGPTQVPSIGLASLTGYPGGGPREVGVSYGDPNGGNCAAIAVLAALSHRRRTGAGQYIDMSQWEAAIPLVGEGLMTWQMTGAEPPRMGNRDEFEAPQGVFRCAGEDRWVAVSCWSDDEWRALSRAIGRADLSDDPSLATRAGRKAQEGRLEDAIAGWSAGRSAEDAAGALRAAGVPAQPVLTTREVADDPELAARGLWVQLPHPEAEGATHVGIPWQLHGTPVRVRRSAPTLGQHTDEILRDVLGLSEAQVAALRAAGVLE
jgi:crotonobetainyl-CoA:carnitine CoA-transferase CaiB-like acyl-CoA transferase